MHTKPKKSLGQNFLVDRNVQRKIIAACAFSPQDAVLEIGPGRGALTGLLLESAGFVCGLEIDRLLVVELKKQFGKRENFRLENIDVLKFDLQQAFGDLKKPVRVIGNIPYYITTPIIDHLLGFRGIISDIHLTVQKEFGQRMVAGPGSKEYGAFSCFVQYYTRPEIVFLIKKNSFQPAPKVDSCFLRLLVRKEPAVKVKDEKMLFAVIRTAFQQRRKTLKNTLVRLVPAGTLNRFFNDYALNPKIRPEQLSLQDFANLANLF